MIKGLAHICLLAADLETAERFYCSGLGLKKAFSFLRHGKIVGFYLELSRGGYIEIFQRDGIEANANNPIQHFCLEVDDIDQTGLRLVQHGFEVTQKILGADQSWQMWTADPSGVRIEFHRYTERSSQITHENCILT